MIPLLSYLTQVIAASGLLYGYYHFVLRNKKFHRYNRYYLLGSTIISLTVSFLNIPFYFTESETNASPVLQALSVFTTIRADAATVRVENNVDISAWLNLQDFLLLFYIVILSAFLLRLFTSLTKIKKIAKANPVEKMGDVYFIRTNEPGTPFSFFRWLFWNQKLELNSEKGSQIFKHEVYHIQQKHSLDIILLEIITAACWLNPFFHLIKKEIKVVHEFLADEYATNGSSKWKYAEHLLMIVFQTNERIVTPFFNNQIKRRIAMITNSKKTGYQYLRKLMVLPIVSTIFLFFSFTYHKRDLIATKLLPENTSTQIVDTIKPLKNHELSNTTAIASTYPGGISQWNIYLMKNINPCIGKSLKPGVYTTYIKFNIDKDGAISNLKPLTNWGGGLEEEVIRVLESSIKWNPAKNKGKAVVTSQVQPIVFQIGNAEKKYIKNITDNNLLGEIVAICDNSEKIGQGKNTPKISLEELRMATAAELANIPTSCKLISFSFSIDLINGDIAVAPNNGEKINPSVKKLIAEATVGRLVTIDDIRVLKDGLEIKMPSQAYIITH